MFSLLQRDGQWSRKDLIPPGCTSAPNQDRSSRYDNCLFSIQRNGFDLSFWLSGENVAYADPFADFVLRKLASWRVKEGD
jgi:hypothetical protein